MALARSLPTPNFGERAVSFLPAWFQAPAPLQQHGRHTGDSARGQDGLKRTGVKWRCQPKRSASGSLLNLSNGGMRGVLQRIETRMKLLTRYKSRNGYEWIVIDRRGNIALSKSGGNVGFEVFEVQSHNGREIGGKWCEPAEYAPSNEQWGSKGWSFQTEELARKKFDELTAIATH